MSSWTSEAQDDVLPHKTPAPRTQVLDSLSAIDRHEQIFAHYSTDQQFMSVDDMRRFWQTLAFEPVSYEVLLFYFLCRAKHLPSLAKADFLHGLRTLVDHIDHSNDLRTALLNYDISAAQNEFYLWTYQFGVANGHRQLTTENAIGLWRLFYSKRVDRPPMLEHWLHYLENGGSHAVPRTIRVDLWMMFPCFAEFLHLTGYGSYDSNEAWPCLFDDFVDYRRKAMLVTA